MTNTRIWLACLIVFSCASQERNTFFSNCVRDFKENTSKARQGTEQEKYFSALKKLESGKKILEFQAQSACEYLAIQDEPTILCQEFSVDTFNDCQKNHLNQKILEGKVDYSVLTLSASFHITMWMNFRKAYLKEKPPLFWPKGIAEHSLTILESLPRRKTMKEMLGADAETPEGKWLIDYEDRSVLEVKNRYSKILNKLLVKMEGHPKKEAGDEAYLRDLRAKMSRMLKIK